MKVLGFLITVLFVGNVFAATKAPPQEKAPLNCIINLPNPSGDGKKAFSSKHDDYTGNEVATYTYENQGRVFTVTAEIWKGYPQGSGTLTTLGNLKIAHNGEYVINHCEGDPCNTELTVSMSAVGFTVDCTTK